jgi:hypothetical protein
MIGVHVKGMEIWIRKGCDLLAKRVKVGISNGKHKTVFTREKE